MTKKIYHIPYKNFITRSYCFGDIFNKTPLIILHGGPGGCDERYEPLEKLAEFGIPLIFYDQLGCGYSKVPKNSKISWNFRIFLDELANLIRFFGLKNYSILGHSWGGMLALEYVTKKEQKNIEKLILFSTLPSTKFWNEEHMKMIDNYLPEEKQALLAEKDGKKYDKKAYNSAIKKFYREHVGKKSVEVYSFKRKVFPKSNREMYKQMWGNSELFGTGNLKNWSVEKDLNKIKVPTLIISGAFDESTPAMNKMMNEKIPDSEWLLLKNSHHIGYAEETEIVIKKLVNFLTN